MRRNVKHACDEHSLAPRVSEIPAGVDYWRGRQALMPLLSRRRGGLAVVMALARQCGLRRRANPAGIGAYSRQAVSTGKRGELNRVYDGSPR